VGRSGRRLVFGSTGDLTTVDYAGCLAHLLDALGIGSAHIVGLLWGGILAQEFYRSSPRRVRSLVLACAYAGWRGSLSEAVWRERLRHCLLDSTGPAEALVAKLFPGMFTDAVPENVREELGEIMSEFHPVGLRIMSRSSAEMDTRDLLPRIDVPTLLLWGSDDSRSPMHIAKQFHDAIAGAELEVISKAGHFSNMEQPDVFNAHDRRFCLQHDAAGPAR
jgi:pimeloyl-ACP methyl ester carboxylesterase